MNPGIEPENRHRRYAAGGMGWTEDRIGDRRGSVAVVTGANSGIGYWVSVGLARVGARVVMACRDLERAEQAAERLRAEVGGADVVTHRLDLADLDGVEASARSLLSTHERIDLLVNNAGVMSIPTRELTPQGFEMQLAVNHLGPFAWTGHLLPALLAAPAARVVTVSSFVHRKGRLNLDDLQSQRGYQPAQAYADSKLANLLFAFELDRRATGAGSALISAAAHPGWARTELQTTGPSSGGRRSVNAVVVALATRVVAQSARAGARPVLFAATEPDVHGGAFVGVSGRSQLRGSPKLAQASQSAYDIGVARVLWERSEGLTGVAYRF
jgi:NAD(P)-dependent dehydrogenase (short-subunit alcohol dehydrogenase family)